jgi:RNase II-type exonuclease C-terminal S1 domain
VPSRQLTLKTDTASGCRHETKPHGVVQVEDPAINGRIMGDHLPLGVAVLVRLTEASVANRKVIFDLIG